MVSPDSARRRTRRYIILVTLVVLVCGGWSAFWFYAAHEAQRSIAGWKAREAAAGRDYTCGQQTLRGFPFRIEIDCAPAAAAFTSGGVPVTVAIRKAIVAAQIYGPDLMIAELTGPLTVGEQGKPPQFLADWKSAVSSVGGNPVAPNRTAVVFEHPTLDRVDGGQKQPLLDADHVEFHGRLVGGTVFDHPDVELALSLKHAALPAVRALAAAPLDGEVVATLKGLKDFTPKPWPARFREIQANGGSIVIDRMRVEQGQTLAVGNGTLTLDANGYLNGKLNVTVAGLAPFLNSIGADVAVKQSPEMDKVAGFLNRLSPGLGNAAREQIGSHLTFGIKAIEGNATLEGRPAVALPLNVDKGAVSLGPVPLGQIPPLF